MSESWIKHPTILSGQTVDLLPLEYEHFEELYQAASDKKLWELIPTDCSNQEKFNAAYTTAIQDRGKGHQYPFMIYHKVTKEMIGSTRLSKFIPMIKNWKLAGHGL